MRENKRNSRDDKSRGEEKRKSSEADKKSFTSATSRKPDDKRRSFKKQDSQAASGEKDFSAKKTARFTSDRKSETSKDSRSFNPRFKSEDNKGKKTFSNNTESKGRGYIKSDSTKRTDKSGNNVSKDVRPFRKRAESDAYRSKNTELRERKPKPSKQGTSHNLDGKVRLNRYIANAGICSRRKADELIEAGVISVNNEIISELGFKVDPAKDVVKYNGALLKREKKVYVLLNKPKDYITTTDDPQERRTVMQLVEKASRERIYPVGRLDRNTTGLLLMTNDGDLADKLSHPKNGITKIYQVELNKNLPQGDLNKIQFGLELEDGLIKPDSVSYVTGGSKKEIGIQIHSGKNRIVRRIFEHLGYEVVKLDRVVYGNLTKKDLPRGRWRYLDEHELIQIKHLIK